MVFLTKVVQIREALVPVPSPDKWRELRQEKHPAQNTAKYFLMRVLKSNFIPDRSRPGKTTTVTSDWAPRVTGGHATWMQRRGGKQWRRRKERNEERKKAKKIKLRVATLNVGTMTGKEREVADLMERRGVDILCVQETRWKGERARCIGGGYKMWYCGSGSKKNGVGIILKKEHVDRVV